MQSILDAINEWIKEILIGAINGNLSTMFGDVNEKVGTIAAEVGQTPQGWNANIFSMIQTLSENVIVPIAGLVITYVLCYELISMVTEKNNMHDVDTSMFFKWVFKAFVAVYLVTHTFDITMAVFDMAQHVVSGAAGVIGGSTEIDVAAALASMQDGLDAMEIPELLLLVMETSLVSLCMKIMSVLITVILYGRMIEIYLYCSVSPIPFATMTNREWGQIGNNYLKSLFAIGFQGFLIMICVGIYAVLVNNMIIADNLHSAIFSLAAYTVILCFSLFKSGALAKSIFSAHCDTHRELRRHKAKEVTFSDMTLDEARQLHTFDEYFKREAAETVFEKAGKKITPKLLLEAIRTLPEEKRKAILLYYFEGMNDTEIAELFNTSRSTIQYRRTSSFEKLRKYLEENADEWDEW